MDQPNDFAIAKISGSVFPPKSHDPEFGHYAKITDTGVGAIAAQSAFLTSLNFNQLPVVDLATFSR